MQPGCFARDLPSFLETGFIGGINHDWDNPIGKPLSAQETGEGLESSAQLSQTTAGKDAHILLKDRVIQKLSIGYEPLEYKFLDTEKAVRNHWDSVGWEPSPADLARSKYGAVLMERVKLIEYSPVTRPGNSRTNISNVLAAPPAGAATMEEQIEMALAADEELLERVKGLLDKRSADGRKLSAVWQIRLRKLNDGYSALLAQANAGGVDLERNKRMNQAASHEFLSWMTTNTI
jgi:phage head maturation protease